MARERRQPPDRRTTNEADLPAQAAALETREGEDLDPSGATSVFEGASIRRNTVHAFISQIITGAFTTALTLYLLRTLGPDGYGVFALALGIGGVVGIFADLGVPDSVSRFLAENRGDRAAVVGMLADALRLKLASAALASGALFAAAGPLAAAFDKPALLWPIRGIAVAGFASSVLTLYTFSFTALARVGVNVRLTFLESLVETVASVTLVAAGGGTVGAVFGRAIGYAFGAVVALVIVARVFGRSAVRSPRRGAGRTWEIARYALPLFVTEGVYVIYAQVDVLIIGALLGTTAVGLFSAPLRLSVPLGYVGQSLASGVSPRQARTGAEKGSVTAFQTSLRWLIVYQAVLLAPVVVWAEPIVRLVLGPHFRGSVDVLRVLAVYFFFGGPSRLISTTVNYLGRAAGRIPIVLVSLALNTGIDLILLPRIGVVGAAVGTGVALSLLYVPAHFRICRQELGLELGPIALTLLRSLVSAALMGSVLYAVGTRTLSAKQWLLGGVAGALAFCVGLAVTGELTPTEIRKVRQVVIAGLARVTFSFR